jgi:hypothetical protein
VLLAGPSWPGGPPAEGAAVAAVAGHDRVGFLWALGEVLDRHAPRDRDPRALVSLPALGLASRALATGVVTSADLPKSRWLPASLLADP